MFFVILIDFFKKRTDMIGFISVLKLIFSYLNDIAFATWSNKEWGTIGSNYFKNLFALAIQGFFIMVCVAIYSVLVSNITIATNLYSALWSVAAYTIILCFSLLKTGSFAKSIVNAT